MNLVSNPVEIDRQSVSAAVDLRRLVAIGVGLPALIVLANQSVLSQRIYARSPVIIVCVMAFYVLQIATIGWVVGTQLKNGILRWFMFGWIMILIDLQLAVITSENRISIGGECLATGILAGQLGIIIVWGMLGSVQWIWRVPCLLVVLMTWWNFYSLLKIVNSIGTYYGNWGDIAIVQGVLLSLLAGTLRLSGYSLTRVEVRASTSNPRSRSAHQFGIRDVFIWTASLAVVLAIARAGNLLNVEFVKRFYGAKMLFVFTATVCSTAIMIVALWAALGAGSVWLRTVVLILLSTAIGVPVGAYCGYVVGQGPRWWAHSIWLHAGYWWIGWMLLTGLLLAASLLIFRTQGYRLVRATGG